MPAAKSGDGVNILIIAGEASGDLHASALMRAIKDCFQAVGRAEKLDFWGIGGPMMRKEGLRAIFYAESLSVVGLIEVIFAIPSIIKAFSLIARHISKKRPSLVILIDFPDFNMLLMRLIKGLFNIPVLYFITPQVWAWRKRRAGALRKYADACAVILPFEEGFLRGMGLNAEFVGNPLVDIVSPSVDAQAFLKEMGMNQREPVIGLLPGSRRQEIKRHCPILLRAVLLLKERKRRFQYIMPLTSRDLIGEDLKGQLQKEGVRIVYGRTYDAMNASSLLVTASGTVTLEATILNIPHIVIYVLNPLTYLIGRLIVKTPYISLTNLVAEKEVVKELIQDEANPENIVRHIERLIDNEDERVRIINELRQAKKLLGSTNAAQRAADIAIGLIAH